MQVTLKELNRGFQTLMELCDQKLPKDNGELITRLSRIRRTARKAIEIWEEDQKTIAVTFGFKITGPGQPVVPVEEGEVVTPKMIEDFSVHCNDLMKKETVKFRGERFTEAEWKQYKPLFNLSPKMEDDLEWLLPLDAEEEETAEKAAGATA